MKFISNTFFRKKSINYYGLYFFLTGVFFLPSTLFIGLLFLLPAAIIGSFINNKSYFNDKWNYPFLIFGVLVLISSLMQNFILNNNYSAIWDPSLSIIGMGNWLPFLWLFWAFQPYLDSECKRRQLSVILIAGTFPVLVTGFGQYYFNWHGPISTLNGLIVWYQRPISFPGGLSGLFNNQNYAGTWLNFVWPFSLALLLEKRNDLFRIIVTLSFLFSIGFSAFLTYSRNAWLGLSISLPIMIGKRGLIFLLPIMIIIILILLFVFSPFFSSEIQSYIRSLFPEKLLLEFASEGYKGLDSTRLEIFSSAINLIKTSPIFGIGAASFPEIYNLETTFWKGHSHNLIIELAISYGLPSSIIFFATIILIVVLSGKVIFLNKRFNYISLFDRAFWVAFSFFLISQLADIQYFDGKISLIAWILISGLKNIIEENNSEIFESL